MSQYQYSPLSPKPNSIRLLRLLPHENDAAPIKCHLIDYSLTKSRKRPHMYEALSYVWGNPDETVPIYIDQYVLHVTKNLHAALLHLRDSSFERIMWVDAICINQENLKERENQIRIMAQIYSQASRVIAWLGDAADDSDRALDEIRLAATLPKPNAEERAQQAKHPQIFPPEAVQKAVLALLRRPWFRRIWILQEAASARHILIMCGDMEIDGYVFSLGMETFMHSAGEPLPNVTADDYSNVVNGVRSSITPPVSLDHPRMIPPDLQNRIHPVISLIKPAAFRKRHEAKMNTSSLGHLIDKFHTHEAKLHHDKIYALLGMSPDIKGAAGLLPDYGVSWKELLYRVVKLLVKESTGIRTCSDHEVAVFETKACILGEISSVGHLSDVEDGQDVWFSFKDPLKLQVPETPDGHSTYTSRWNLEVSAKPIQRGDIVCLPQEASRPMIVRPYLDHFAVVMIEVPQWPLQLWAQYNIEITESSHNFLLLWDWEDVTGKFSNEGHRTLLEKLSLFPENFKEGLEWDMYKARRLWNAGLVIKELGNYQDTEQIARLEEAKQIYERFVAKNHLDFLEITKTLALAYIKTMQVKKARDLLVEMQPAKRPRGFGQLGVFKTMASKALEYGDIEHRGVTNPEKLDIMIRILGLGSSLIKERQVVQIAVNFDEEVMQFLLDCKGDEIVISKRVLVAAATNERSGTEVMMTLLVKLRKSVRMRDDFHIPLEVMAAAVGNRNCAMGLFMTFLQLRGSDRFTIPESVLVAAAGNEEKGIELITFFLDCRVIRVTELVLMAAAFNAKCGREIMELLLRRKKQFIKITEPVLVEAARNEGGKWSAKKVMLSLLEYIEYISDEIQITQRVMEAAEGNSWGGEELMALLRRHPRSRSAARNYYEAKQRRIKAEIDATNATPSN